MIQIGDYFSKGGFEDGDNDALVNEAYLRQEEIAAMLEAEFLRRKLPYRVVCYECGTCHNPVRMELRWTRNGKVRTWDYYYGHMREAGPGSVAQMERLRGCSGPPRGFEEAVKSVQQSLDGRP